MIRPVALFGSCAVLSVAPLASAQFVDFNDVTATNLVLSTVPDDDTQEKDLSAADFDKDGWEDVVVVRKRRFSNAGARTDLLLMNRNGVLMDETGMFAPEFLTNPTDARDVTIIDVNMDTWPDIFITNTFGEQPVLYVNQGEDGGGNWLGLADESNRLPNITAIGPLQYCAGWQGDLTGNGAPDIYMINYNPGGVTSDNLLINDGTGNFTDETAARLNSAAFGDYFRSAFGTDVEFHDVDNDGDLDILKLTTLFDVAPFNDRGVFVLFNNGSGFFNTRPFQEISDRFDPYMFEGCDLDNNGMVDIFVVSDGNDSFRLAQSVTPDGPNTYGASINPTSSELNGFGGNVHIADFDNDGDEDIMISPIDTDIQNCESGGRVVLLENMGIATANMVDADPAGTQPWSTEAFDFVFFDLNNDNRLDILFGDCTGYTLITQEVDLCTGDCDFSGAVDFNDLVCALFEFGTADLAADCDTSGTVDFNDLVCMLFLFGPCP